MKLDRSKVKFLKISEDQDDGYVEGDPGERFVMVWEITRDLWGFGGNGDAERRLQRDVTTLIRGGR
jgi:hypothetical protein